MAYQSGVLGLYQTWLADLCLLFTLLFRASWSWKVTYTNQNAKLISGIPLDSVTSEETILVRVNSL